MTNTPNRPEHAIDRTLEHALTDDPDERRAAELQSRLDATLSLADLNDVLARIEAKVLEARAAIDDELEGQLCRAINDLIVEAFLAHRVVSTW